MDMVKLKVKYEVYRRYEPGPIVVGIINAPTLRSALLDQSLKMVKEIV